MWKKVLGLFLGCLVVVGLTSAIYLWIDRTGNGIGEVAWSPLYASRERNALVPVTSQVAYGALQTASAPTCVGTPTCGTTCPGTATCEGDTCEGTCNVPTCQETCDGWTCEGTCEGYTCDKTCGTTCPGAAT